MRFPVSLLVIAVLVAGTAAMPRAQAISTARPRVRRHSPAVAAPPLPPDYVVGPEDVLSIVFWRDKEMTSDVVVRPDGKISLPVLNDIDVAGLTPLQVQQRILAVASRYFEDAAPTVIVKEIKSRR